MTGSLPGERSPVRHWSTRRPVPLTGLTTSRKKRYIEPFLAPHVLVRSCVGPEKASTEKFLELVDQLTAYVTEPIYYAMGFVDGSSGDIHIFVALHRPSNLDTAASHALLHEEFGADPIYIEVYQP